MKKIVLLVVLLVFGVAHADRFGSGGHGRGDGGAHTACWVPDSGITSPPSGPVAQQFNYLKQLPIAAIWRPRCPPGTDMFLDDRYSNPNYYGVRTCKKFSSSGICDESSVRINKQLIQRTADNERLSRDAALRFNWCHEIGHSFGLAHSSVEAGSNCMRTGLHTDRVYRSHHRDHAKSL